ncbi:TylF/MycF/NovP-related O-methyltransferase [Photorhabdus africana]|uniref:TylF/MycF/NovP-related O-methyltransferase n=1 Tax=Photorhabdus africana TaxID=3097554 RepID=UPI002B415C44|nr:TylF/MycF/NovP-related O-methyltransferase [Photorhabdus sp. CRI-LC]
MNIESRYIKLLAKSIMNEIYDETPIITSEDISTCQWIIEDLDRRKSDIFREYPHLRDAMNFAHMISYTRRSRRVHTYVKRPGIDNVISCCECVINENVPGGFMEIGTLRGGISILMNGIITAHGDSRQVFVVDSFQGLPDVSENDSLFDKEIWSYYSNQLKNYMFDCKCSLEEVKSNFSTYDLLTENVKFISGWVQDTLKDFSETLSIIRLDVDWYEATKCSLEQIYKNLSPNGFIIIDDYNLVGCKKAVDEFRDNYSIQDEIVIVDATAGIIYWRKT